MEINVQFMPRSSHNSINTKYGSTNEIELENGIRQGKCYQDQSLGCL